MLQTTSYPDNISSRTRTSASVAWSPPAWSSGNFYQTPDLKSIVQEIIDRSDWQTGNALAFIITGSGTRKAKSYDGSGEEPVLHIEYQVPGLGNDFEEDTDCVALWRMEDGALITDSIGTHTLTNSGAVSDTNTFVEDLGSADFECSESDTMVIADSDLDSDFPLKNGTSNNQFSVCFWTQLESLPGDQYLISKYDATNNKRSFAISVDSSGYISHAIGTSGGSSAETNTSTTALSTGTWYHVGATFDDSDKSWSLKVWDYDAESVVIDMSGVNTNNINIEDANWVIGGTDDGSGYLDGLMDEVVVFKDVLTSDEIDEIRAGVYTAAPWSGIVYTYDPSGRRINKNVDNVDTSYAYDGGHCIAEYGESGDILRKYIYGPGTDNPILMIEVQDANAEYYYHRDGLGNVVALSNADGNTVQTYDYSIYGLPAAADANHPNPYLFTGRRFDFETGLYYYRARMYHPNIGRFLQTDPIGYGDGMNWYAYCGNNPANCTDPSGMVEYDYRLTRVPYYYTVGGIPGVSEFIMMEITRHGRSVVQTLLFTNLGYVLDVLVSGQYKAGSGFPFPVEQNVDISEYIPSDWGKRFSHWKIARKNPRIFFALDLLLKLEVFSIDQYDSIQDSVRIEIRHGVTSYSGQGAGRISNSYWGVVWNDQQTDVFENMRSNPQNGIIGHWDWQGVRSIAVLAHELAHYWLPFGDEENAIIVENHARFAIWQLDPSTHSTLYPRPLNGYVGPGGNPNAPNLRRYPWDAWPVYIESMESR